MTQPLIIRSQQLGHGRSTPIVVDEAHGVDFREISRKYLEGTSMPPDPHWAERLPGNVYRLVSWLSVIELPEHDAAVAVSRLSRADLSG
jgi:hypothetical protein